MNVIPYNAIVVREISHDTIKVMVQDYHSLTKVKDLGFSISDDSIYISADNECKKLEIIHSLIGLNALFLFGYGWYPSEVMALYKEQGVITEGYRVISWSDPINYRIEER